MHHAMHRLLAAALLVLPTAAMASDFGPEEHLAGFCLPDKPGCAGMQKQLRKEWPQALKGDYDAQRNVAFCLRSGCDGAVRQNDIQSCAWRIVLLASGSGKIGSVDVANYRDICEKVLEPVAFSTARAQAARLFDEIYRKPIPAGPWSP